tara:strand:+ start:68858 stop:70966 length:2109 start_codon:yes stop_codon:yes gene_type:complete
MGLLPNSSNPLFLLPLSLLALAASHWASPTAGADTLTATHGNDLAERGHKVRVERRGDDVVFLVRRTIANRSALVEEVDLEFQLPPQAVTTSLRTKHGSEWISGRLLPEGEALATYERLTNSGPRAARGPALLSWQEQGEQRLRIFPIAPHATVTVEFEFNAPTCYDSGRRIAFYPKTEDLKELRPAKLRLAKGTRGLIPKAGLSPEQETSAEACAEKLGNESLAEGDAHIIVFADETSEFADETSEPLRVRFGTHQMGSTRSLSELIVEVSPSLGSIPRKAEIVFVLDVSYSQSNEDIKAQLDLVLGYLANLPDARYQLVLAKRGANALFPEFQPSSGASKTLAMLRKHLPERGNGSNLDAAVGLAATLFDAKAGGAQRIIAFTDSEFRKTLTAKDLSGAMANTPNVLLHVIDSSGYSEEGEFSRDDEHFLANAVQATGGVLGTVSPATSPALTKAAMLALVRPSKIEMVSIETSEGWGEMADLAETIDEGFGLRTMDVFDAAPGPFAIKGKIWGRQLVWNAKNDKAIAAQIPALSVGRELVDALSPAELLEVATAGQVVSSATSYLANKPGTTPSSYDYEGIITACGCGAGSMHGMHHSITTSCGGMIGKLGTTIGEGVDYGAALAGLLKTASVSCSVSHTKPDLDIALQIETTGQEIVDVLLPSVGSPYAQCVAEAAWDMQLGTIFSKHSGRTPVVLRR